MEQNRQTEDPNAISILFIQIFKTEGIKIMDPPDIYKVFITGVLFLQKLHQRILAYNNKQV